MNIIFEIPKSYVEAIDDICGKCGERCYSEEKENLSGDQIIAIVAIATPLVWELVERYLPDRMVNVNVQLDEKTTVTISERSVTRGLMKARKIRAEWERIT